MIEYLISFSFWITKHRFFWGFSSLTTCRPSKRSDLIFVQNLAQFFFICKECKSNFPIFAIFSLKILTIVWKKILSKNMRNIMERSMIQIWLFCFIKDLRFGLKPPPRNFVPRPRMLMDWIPLANWLSGITGYRFWMRFADSPKMLSKKSTILKKQKIENLSNLDQNPFQNIAHHLRRYISFKRF